MKIRFGSRSKILVLILSGALQGDLRAHGGEDHGETQPAAHASVGALQGNILTTSGQTEHFELVLKYPATEADEDVIVRLYLSDYSTNRPIDSAQFQLSFKPAGVELRQAPRKVAPGIYEAVLGFPDDTIYSVVATVNAARRMDFVEVRNLYAGEAAERFLAEHELTNAIVPADNRSAWIIPVGVATVALTTAVSIWLWTRRKRKDRAAVPNVGAARDPELTTQTFVVGPANEKDHREGS